MINIADARGSELRASESQHLSS